MIKKRNLGFALGLLALPLLTMAESAEFNSGLTTELNNALSASPVLTTTGSIEVPPKPKRNGGFYIGLGGSYNSVALDQYLNVNGDFNVVSLDALIASGSTGGSIPPFHNTQTTFSPLGQIGYFHHFSTSDWLWNMKFLYQYLGVTAAQNNIVAPVPTALDPEGGAIETISEQIVVGSVQTNINNELLLLVSLGHSWKKSTVYLGAGPLLLSIESNGYNITSNVDSSTASPALNSRGLPNSFYNNQWLWGGAGQLGIAYNFRPTMFLDLNYTYAITAKYQWDRSVSSNNVATSGEISTFSSGNVNVNASDRITIQSLGASLNWVF